MPDWEYMSCRGWWILYLTMPSWYVMFYSGPGIRDDPLPYRNLFDWRGRAILYNLSCGNLWRDNWSSNREMLWGM